MTVTAAGASDASLPLPQACVINGLVFVLGDGGGCISGCWLACGERGGGGGGGGGSYVCIILHSNSLPAEVVSSHGEHIPPRLAPPPPTSPAAEAAE